MAEMLGAVASGISIAQFAGSIIKTGFRIKTLLDDVRDVPEDLNRHLGQIQVLAPLLAEIDHGPWTSNRALLAATEQCRQAALELDVLATELSNQVQSSQGFNRRFRSFHAVLQKGTLARHVKRTQGSMQMLMLALQLTSLCRQNELIQLQQSQPGLIAAEVIGSLDIAQRSEQSLRSEKGTVTETRGSLEKPQPTPRTDATPKRRLALFQPTTTIGLEWLTGSVHLQTPDRANTAENRTGRDEEPISYRFRFQFPRWLSERALESLFYKDAICWKHILVPYSVREPKSEVGTQIDRIMAEDDVEGLRMSLQCRVIALRDRFIRENMEVREETGKLRELTRSREDSLFSLATTTGAWKIGCYLEDMGIAQEVSAILYIAWDNKNTGAYHRRDFLQRLDEFFPIKSSLETFNGTIDEFQALRRTFWPDTLFFHESFTDTRLELAAGIATTPPMDFANQNLLQCEKLRNILLYPAAIGFGTDMHCLKRTLGGVVQSIGQAALGDDASVIRAWAELWMELADAHPASEFDNFFRDTSGRSIELQRNPFVGWLSLLLGGVRQAVIARRPRHRIGRRPYTHYKFDKAMNQAIRVYLGLLQTRGVDPVLAYENEMPVWEVYVKGWKTRNVFIDMEHLTLYYIGITYGPNPEDWRFWSADNTESYAGEFWELVDPAPLWIPGSWVDDDMD